MVLRVWLSIPLSVFRNSFADLTERAQKICSDTLASQRSLHNAPIFRLLLKVAVNGTHQCDFPNFCGAVRLQLAELLNSAPAIDSPNLTNFFTEPAGT